MEESTFNLRTDSGRIQAVSQLVTANYQAIAKLITSGEDMAGVQFLEQQNYFLLKSIDK